MDEQSLISGCKRGEEKAFRCLYDTYAPAMLSLCMRYVNDYEAARDLVQDGFVRVFTKIGDYKGEGAFGGWVRKIFVNAAITHLRQEKALKQTVDIDEHPQTDSAVAAANAVDKLSADELMACIARLPSGYRVVFNMFAIEGYSHKEIAQALNIQEVTSRSQFIRAKELLQKYVKTLINEEYEQKYEIRRPSR